MADNEQKSNDQKLDDQTQQPPAQPTIVIPDVTTQLRMEQQAIAAIALEAERKHLDETEPGGRYKVNGRYVDAEGKLHKNQKD